MSKEIISLPKELSHLDKIVKSSVQSSKDARCLTVMRCIPYTDKETWDEIYSALGSKDWFAVEVDADNMDKLLEPLYEKTKEYAPKKNVESIKEAKPSGISQCIVHANEKHFLFFGTSA